MPSSATVTVSRDTLKATPSSSSMVITASVTAKKSDVPRTITVSSSSSSESSVVLNKNWLMAVFPFAGITSLSVAGSARKSVAAAVPGTICTSTAVAKSRAAPSTVTVTVTGRLATPSRTVSGDAERTICSVDSTSVTVTERSGPAMLFVP